MRPVPWNPNAVYAEYLDQPFPEHRGNPYIETLPRPLSRIEAARAMARFPEYDLSYRLLPREQREDWLPNLDQIRQPMTVHLDLYGRIRRLIIGGYLERNPAVPNFYQLLDTREERAFGGGTGESDTNDEEIRVRASWGRPAARGLALLGVTGIGKTALIKMCLSLFPQVILHTSYQGRRFHTAQVVNVHLQAPKNGSIVTTCVNFFQAIDDLVGSDYEKTMTRGSTKVEHLMPRMARVAALHGLGLLVVDEIQELKESAGERAFISFLGRLSNEIGIPIAMVGGVDALPIFRAQARLARRVETEGDVMLDRSQPGAEWRLFVERIWRYQVTCTETPLDDKLLGALLDASQGITDYAVKLYKLAQLRAMAVGGDERITPEIIRSAAEDSQLVAQPFMRALRIKNDIVLDRMGDVRVPEGLRTTPFARGDMVEMSGTDAAMKTEPDGGDAMACTTVDALEEKSSSSAKPVRTRKKSVGRSAHPATGEYGDSLPRLGKAAKDAGDEPYTGLVAAGLIRGESWSTLVSY